MGLSMRLMQVIILESCILLYLDFIRGLLPLIRGFLLLIRIIILDAWKNRIILSLFVLILPSMVSRARNYSS